MEYVSNDVKVTPGEAVLTSGQDRIFPEGFAGGHRGATPCRIAQRLSCKSA